jgi:hypothetical protein
VEGDNWARGNYAANGSSEYTDDAYFAWGDPETTGVMGVVNSRKMGKITDGSSNTLLVAEIRAGLSADDRRGVWAMGSSGANSLFKHGFGGDANGPNPCNDNSDDIIGCTTIVNSIGLETMRRECMTCWEGCPSHQQAPRSLHEGGLYALMADGSTHFISDTINTSGPWGGCCSVWDRMIASQDGLPLVDAF